MRLHQIREFWYFRKKNSNRNCKLFNHLHCFIIQESEWKKKRRILKLFSLSIFQKFSISFSGWIFSCLLSENGDFSGTEIDRDRIKLLQKKLFLEKWENICCVNEMRRITSLWMKHTIETVFLCIYDLNNHNTENKWLNMKL